MPVTAGKEKEGEEARESVKVYEAAGRKESLNTDAGFHRTHADFEVHYRVWRERCPRDISNGHIRIPRRP